MISVDGGDSSGDPGGERGPSIPNIPAEPPKPKPRKGKRNNYDTQRPEHSGPVGRVLDCLGIQAAA